MMKNILIYIILFLFLSSCSVSGLKRAETRQPVDIPDNMVFIPAGYFYMGNSSEEGSPGIDFDMVESPKQRIFLDSFYIDKFEVTNSQYRQFVERSGTKRPLPEYMVKKWMYPEFFGIDDNPVVDVDWFSARDYCRWMGKRLPTEAEWEKAARGTDGRRWPWGNESEDSWLNSMDSGPRMPLKGGSFPEDVSPYGVFDMAGNVMEWTATWYDAYPMSGLKDALFGQKYIVIRGGSFDLPIQFARTSHRAYYQKSMYVPGFSECPGNMDLGFRCAMDAAPGGRMAQAGLNNGQY